MIPETYSAWRHCIVEICKLQLHAAFISERIKALQDPHDHMTRRLRELYGEDHHRQLLGWFRQAQQEARGT